MARERLFSRAMAEVLARFLSSDEVADLRQRSERVAAWRPGRQHTGYEICPLQDEMPPAHPLIARALARIGTPVENRWDVYFIRYLDGSHIPPHVDPADPGHRHRRLNVVLGQAAAGGTLVIDGRTIELGVGDAVLFYPDAEVHSVSAVRGTRLLFSVGAWIEGARAA